MKYKFARLGDVPVKEGILICCDPEFTDGEVARIVEGLNRGILPEDDYHFDDPEFYRWAPKDAPVILNVEKMPVETQISKNAVVKSTLFESIAEVVMEEDFDHLTYLLTKDYCLLTHESGDIIVCSGTGSAQKHPNFGKPGWKLEDGVYLVKSRNNRGLERTKKMLMSEYWEG